jgi:transposase-like protein
MPFTGGGDSRAMSSICVRWYLTYRLSYRDLVALMAEREVHLTHTTIMRWVLRFVPEYEKRWNRRAKPVGSSWRVDETLTIHLPKLSANNCTAVPLILRIA